MDLIGGLTAARLAIDLVKDLRAIDRTVDEATFKLKLADLTSALADTQLALSDAKLKVSDLEEALRSATAGNICPVCRSGRLKVTNVEPHDWSSGTEFHKVACDHEGCGYSTMRTYDATSGRYTTK
jgi:hypothetical protein